jgi:hypothetical protein
LTGGSDRKIAYWETYDGAQIREVDGSKSSTINGLDVDMEGKFFVTGSADKLVKVICLNKICMSDQAVISHTPCHSITLHQYLLIVFFSFLFSSCGNITKAK